MPRDRRRRNEDEPPPLPSERKPKGLHWLAIVGILFGGTVILALFAFAAALELGYIADSALRRGDDVPKRIVEQLREEVLGADETVEWFYSTAVTNILEDGNLLTNERVVSYWNDDGELYLDATALDDVRAIRVQFSDEWLTDTELWVWSDAWFDADEEAYSVFLYLSNEDGRDHDFVRDLVSAARRADADLVSVEVGGDVTEREIDEIPGATRYSGDDWGAQPDALLDQGDR